MVEWGSESRTWWIQQACSGTSRNGDRARDTTESERGTIGMPMSSTGVYVSRCACALVLSAPIALAAQLPRGTVRDSAGVRIISFDSAMVPVLFEMRHSGLELGTEPGSELVRVTAALRMPTGKILVADGGRRHLLRFGADGTLEKVIGRDGQGPGEFARLSWMGRHGRD